MNIHFSLVGFEYYLCIWRKSKIWAKEDPFFLFFDVRLDGYCVYYIIHILTWTVSSELSPLKSSAQSQSTEHCYAIINDTTSFRGVIQLFPQFRPNFNIRFTQQAIYAKLYFYLGHLGQIKIFHFGIWAKQQKLKIN